MELRGFQQEKELTERRAREAEARGGELRALRPIFEACGGARAKVEACQGQIERHLSHATRHEGRANELRKQIDDLRSQLQRYSDALENDLITGRDRIAAKVKEAIGYEQRFGEASSTLIRQLREKAECRDMIEDLVASDRNKRGEAAQPRASGSRPVEPQTDPSPQRVPNV